MYLRSVVHSCSQTRWSRAAASKNKLHGVKVSTLSDLSFRDSEDEGARRTPLSEKHALPLAAAAALF